MVLSDLKFLTCSDVAARNLVQFLQFGNGSTVFLSNLLQGVTTLDAYAGR